MSKVTNDDIMRFLNTTFGDDAKNIATYPEYAGAFSGVTMDGRIIYDFFEMKIIYAAVYKVTIDKAADGVYVEIDKFDKALLRDNKKMPVISMGNPFN